MKPVTIHPFSLLAGAALLGVVLVATGALRVTPIPAGHGPDALLENVRLPDPRDMVVIREGTPLTLPAGRIFVLTALGTTHSVTACGCCLDAELRVDGQRQLYVVDPGLNGVHYGTSSGLQPQFFTVSGPATIEVAFFSGLPPLCLTPRGRAWGYVLNEDQGRSNHPPAGVGIVDPRNVFLIEQGVPFTVPQGKLFVLTGLGNFPKDPYYPSEVENATLFVNGVQELATDLGAPHGSFKPVPPGFTVRGGRTIEVQTRFGQAPGRAWGYLVGERRVRPMAGPLPRSG